MGGSSKSVTTGHRYYMGVHVALGHGPFDSINRAVFGERCAWSTGVTNTDSDVNSTFNINKPDLFGGDAREGGVAGDVDVMWGGDEQGRNTYLQGFQGTNSPAYRGITSLVFKKFLWSAMNPYFKSPWIEGTRIKKGWRDDTCWYPEKAVVAGGGSTLSTRTSVALCIDFSQSMLIEVSPGVTREAVLKAGLIDALTGLKTLVEGGGVIDVALIPFSWRVFNVIKYANATPANIDTLIAAVESMPLVYGTAWDGPLIEAKSFFRASTDCSHNTLIFITDGEPAQRSTDEPTVPYTDAYGNTVVQGVLYTDQEATDFAVAVATELANDYDVHIHTFNIGSGGNTYTSQLDNTPSDGAPVITSPTADAITIAVLNSISVADDMNPAHIIYQCLTDVEWGMGYNTTDIDSASFAAAADTLYDEGFGLSMMWDQQGPIETFVQDVLNHIDGSMRLDMTTGKFQLSLHRGGYDADTLVNLNPSNVLELKSFQRASYGEFANEVVVTYIDRDGNDKTVAVQNLASVQSQGAVVSTTKRYDGIRYQSLAARVAMRDLAVSSTPLAKATVTTNRVLYNKEVGDVVSLTWPDRGIALLPMRILKIDKGNLVNGQIEVELIEDVFSLPSDAYTVDTGSKWSDPVGEPEPVDAAIAYEVPYWEVVRNLSAADLDYLTPDYGFGAVAATMGAGNALNMAVFASADDATFAETMIGDFSPTGVLSSDITQTQTSIQLSDFYDLDNVTLDADNGYAFIGDEAVAVVSADNSTGVVVVRRGVLDTVPALHVAGTRMFFVSDSAAFDQTERTNGEVAYYRPCPKTGIGTLDVSDSTSLELTFANRATRPYPPGQVKVNGSYYPDWIGGHSSLAVSWVHRDRLLQTVSLVDYSQGSIGPESGATYNMRIYDETDALLRTYLGVSGTSQTYTITDEVSDSPIPVGSPSWLARGTVIEASDAVDSDFFGLATALSADGTVLIVGAYAWEGGAGIDRGGVYTYDWSGGTWVQRGSVLTAADAADYDSFGASLALSADGTVLVIGAYTWEDTGLNKGGVYTYDWSGSAWVQRGSVLTAADAVDSDYFGRNVALSADGAVLVVGAHGWEGATGTNRGGVYTYDWSGSAWVQRGSVLTAGDAADSDQFGVSVALSADGTVLVVGANLWEGATGTDRGGVYTYDWSGSAWVQRGSVLTAADAADSDQFGASVALSSDGIVLVVGSHVWEGATGVDRGGVYTYDWSGSAWVQRGSVLTAADAVDSDSFGIDVSLSANGAVLIIGAHRWEGSIGTDRGGVYVYDMEVAFRLNSRLRFELESDRDGLTSMQKHNHTVRRTGYGWNYGMHYG